MPVQILTVKELQKKLQEPNELFLLDVREPTEFAYASIAGSVLIPLNQVPQRVSELDRDREIVVICHHGMRSMQAASYLDHLGYAKVFNLQGGIDAWSLECDSAVRRY
ncbi:MAG: rhodanese-like domain-containing protein [Methylococcales bacterium]|nr:rhodanese-like domain-containing protein [Methylococcales bacterium]